MSNAYQEGCELADLYGRMEYALERVGFVRNTDHAQADWNGFARALGQQFFEDIKASGTADMLLGEPPKKLMKQDMQWLPLHPSPLKNVVELFEQGVCRIRNNFVHGEKFVGGGEAGQWARDAQLVAEAMLVLRDASERLPKVREALGAKQ